MLALLFLPLAAATAAACFYYAYHLLKTPFLWNVGGSICAFLAVFCLGGAYTPSTGPWAHAEDSSTNSALILAIQLLGLAVLMYFVGYLVRRSALNAGLITDADD